MLTCADATTWAFAGAAASSSKEKESGAVGVVDTRRLDEYDVEFFNGRVTEYTNIILADCICNFVWHDLPIFTNLPA